MILDPRIRSHLRASLASRLSSKRGELLLTRVMPLATGSCAANGGFIACFGRRRFGSGRTARSKRLHQCVEVLSKRLGCRKQTLPNRDQALGWRVDQGRLRVGPNVVAFSRALIEIVRRMHSTVLRSNSNPILNSELDPTIPLTCAPEQP
jgi:hypothetical protein